MPVTKSRRKQKYRTVSLFCGLGGEHMGKTLAFRELGIFDQCQFWALNHWEIAVETLQRNFPHALTYCEDITAIDANRAGIDRLDLLWASPSCTHFSGARGGKPCEDQMRSHAMEVYHRWLNQCDVPVFLMENVKEFADWGPLDQFGKPIRERRGEYFRDFVKKLEGIGYEVEWRLLKAADYGDPTSRVRFFLQAVKDGKGIHWPKPTHRDPKTPGTLPVWKSAREHVIDWSIVGKSIFYRKKPLAENTIRRIKHGLKKYGLAPYFAIYHGGPDAANRVADVDEPLGTIDTSNRYSLVEPFIEKGYGGYYTGKGESIDRPLPTVTAHDHNFLVEPFLTQANGWQTLRGEGSLSTGKPLPTVTTANHHGIVEPYLIKYYGTSNSADVDAPLPTVTSGGSSTRGSGNKHCLLNPYIVRTDYTHAGERRTESADDPLSTMTTKNCHAVADAFLVEYYGASKSQGVDRPLPTVTTCDRHGLVQLVVEHEGGIDNLPIVRTPADIDAHDFARPFCIELCGQRFLVDITYRMLEPHELARAMGFPESFKLESLDGKPLTKANAVKMLGNACPVNTVQSLVKAVMQPRIRKRKGKR